MGASLYIPHFVKLNDLGLGLLAGAFATEVLEETIVSASIGSGQSVNRRTGKDAPSPEVQGGAGCNGPKWLKFRGFTLFLTQFLAVLGGMEASKEGNRRW